MNHATDLFNLYAGNGGTDDFRQVMGKAPRILEQFAHDFTGAFRN